MITDGKPSALSMPDGQVYQNSMSLDGYVIAETLREVAACRQSGIIIKTIMLAPDCALVECIKRLSEISRGKAPFTNTMSLGQFVLMDFLRKKNVDRQLSRKKTRRTQTHVKIAVDIVAAVDAFALKTFGRSSQA